MELYLPLLFVLLLLSAFFSSSETAFLTLERVRLEHMVREGRPGALRVSRLLERPRRLLSAILLGNNLANTGAAAIGTVIAAELVSGGQAALLATLAITALLVVSAPPLVVWSRIMRPPVAALDAFSRAMLALVGGAGRRRAFAQHRRVAYCDRARHGVRHAARGGIGDDARSAGAAAAGGAHDHG